MRTLVKSTLSFLMAMLLVTACRQYKDSADDKMQKELSGTWMCEAKYASGRNNEQRLTFAPDRSYLYMITIPNRTNGPRIITMEGTFRVEGGFLVATVTKDSQNYVPVPSTNRIRIVRLDDRELELVLNDEKIPGTASPTNRIVYLKQTK